MRRKRSEADFAEEIKAHLELEAAELKSEGLGEEEDVEVKGAVIIRGVVVIEPGVGHLVDEPSVDALVKVGRLDGEPCETNRGGEEENGDGGPLAF